MTVHDRKTKCWFIRNILVSFDNVNKLAENAEINSCWWSFEKYYSQLDRLVIYNEKRYFVTWKK